MPGTEVAVAPKRRKRDLNVREVSDKLHPNKENHNGKALLRVQDSDRSFFHETDVKGFELRVVLTSVAYIHPETANKCSLQSLQLVSISLRFQPKDTAKTIESETFTMKSSQAAKIADNSTVKSKNGSRQVIVRLLVSDSVAKGHVVMAQSLRLYLRADLHSWVFVKSCNVKLKKEIPVLSVSPCEFKMSGNDKMLETGAEVFLSHKSRKTKNMISEAGLSTYIDVVDWSMHEEVIAALSSEILNKEEQETVYQFEKRKGLECLLYVWALVQLQAIASAAGVDVNMLVLGSETLLHFEVKRFKSSDYGNIQTSTNGYLDDGNKDKSQDIAAEILYVMTISDESLSGDKFCAYELNLDGSNKKDGVGSVKLMAEKVNMGDPVSFYSVIKRNSAKGVSPDMSSLTWMGPITSDIVKRMTVLLSPVAGMWFRDYNLPLPGHVLIYGPPGSGKTVLARAVAKYLEEHKDFLAHVIFVSCSTLSLEKVQTLRPALSGVVSEALEHAPSIIILDDLDSIISVSSDSEGFQHSPAVVALTKLLTDIMDEHAEKRKISCGIGPVAFIASVRSLDVVPQSLCSSGRFDFHVQLAAPATAERGAILKHEIQRRLLQCSDAILEDVASKCEGYDAYDLEILVDRAVHAATGRILPSESCSWKHVKHTLVREDFSKAMHEFVPVAMRDITKSASDGGRSGWDDVGGLSDIRNAIIEMIELPSKFPNIFARAPLRLRSNVLLYGPPGCGKTHIVGAAAAACSLRFISVKGPELLNKYIGASEQAVRDIFAKAAAAAPCLLFFDEFDSIAPKRGHDNTGVTDRVVNQFLTELDGVEVLTGVFVFAATSRPDLLDAALLRPGRLDRLLFCDFPSQHDRFEILSVLSRKLPMASDVDLNAIAQITYGFSGADLQALLSDAQLAAVHEYLSREDKHEPGTTPLITDALLKSIASKARPSVSENEKQRLYDIYSQFLDSKRSVAAQTRDAKGKGKKATLA